MIAMHPVDLQRALSTAVILCDTREQPTKRFEKRMQSIGLPYVRKKLDFGDYSIACTVDDTSIDLSNIVAIERKMSLDEICNCFCQQRGRFEREFLRAKQVGAKIYLLIEGGSWEKAYAGYYRSQMHPNSFIASLTAWLARYNCQILFCEPDTTGKLIHELLYRELKEYLENV